jgi:hypothetical protein
VSDVTAGFGMTNEIFCRETNTKKRKNIFYGMAVALYDFEKEEVVMKAFTAKLVDLTQKNTEAIARQWAKDVKTNAKTYSYHEAPEEKIIRQAKDFYSNFQMMFFHESPYEQAEEIFEKYAEERYREGMPLHEALYALILMRRHMWLYAEFQSLFNVEVEHRQAVESLSRTILMFDYIMYVVTRKFWKMMKLEVLAKENTR